MPCSQCGNLILENYCPQCGQKYSSKKLNLWSVVSDLFSNLFSLERSVGPAIIRLLWNPCKYVQNYFDGFKGFYPSPGKMLLVALTLGGLHLAFVNHQLLGMQFEVEHIAGQLAFFIVFIPILCTGSWLASVYFRQNFLKHLIAGIYLSSSYFIFFQALANLIEQPFGIDLETWPGLAFIVTYIFGIARIFHHGKTWHIILSIVLQFLVVFGILYGLVLLAPYLQNS